MEFCNNLCFVIKQSHEICNHLFFVIFGSHDNALLDQDVMRELIPCKSTWKIESNVDHMENRIECGLSASPYLGIYVQFHYKSIFTSRSGEFELSTMINQNNLGSNSSKIEFAFSH